MRIFGIITITIAALAVALCGCGKSGGGSNAKAEYVIGMSQCTLREPWRVQMNEDIKQAAAQHPEIKVIFKNAQDKATLQQDQMKEFVNLGVDLIIISPLEARPLTKPVADAMAKGIPVIVLDRKIEGDNYTCHIGSDNYKIGKEAGKYMAQLLGGKGRIVELKGLMTSTPAIERHEGFMEGIKGSDIEIIFDADCDWKQENAQAEMASALTRFPAPDAIDAVYAHNDPAAYGAYTAAKLEGKGREKTIKFIGIDALPDEGVRYVKEGVLTATFQYPTGAEEAIETALKILKGEEVPKEIKLGTRIFTADNVETGGQKL